MIEQSKASRTNSLDFQSFLDTRWKLFRG